MSTALQTVLDERGKRYGSFSDNANVSQDLKLAMKHTQRWAELAPIQRECLEQISSKISRILTGDPHYDDNWRDIAGYATLVADYLQPKEPAVPKVGEQR